MKFPEPSNILVRDNGGRTTDRYTIYLTEPPYYVGFSSPDPYSPQGVGIIDTPTWTDYATNPDPLVAWESLPESVQRFATYIATPDKRKG